MSKPTIASLSARIEQLEAIVAELRTAAAARAAAPARANARPAYARPVDEAEAQRRADYRTRCEAARALAISTGKSVQLS